MAKQRGPGAPPRRAKPGLRSPSIVPADPSSDRTPAPAPGSRLPARDALRLYEAGVGALQRRQYDAAMTALRTLLEDHPKETELHERVRLYLNVCERHLHDRETPQTLAERIYAATLAINGGMFDEAERLLSRVLDEAPDHDHAYFMLAIARTGRGATDGALQALCEAVRLNPENRAVARHDPDLVLLRPLPDFQRLVNGHSPRRFDGPPRS